MGIHGTWFVSNGAQVAGMWNVLRRPAIDPFTKEVVTVDSVSIDVAAISALPNVDPSAEGRQFGIDYVCALFGKGVSVEWITPPDFVTLCRIPDGAVHRLVERAPQPGSLLPAWKENHFATLTSSYLDAVDEKLATDLYKLAKMAVESGGSLYGLCSLSAGLKAPIHGTWFVSSEAQVAAMCKVVDVDRAIIDVRAISALPHAEVNSFVEHVCAIFGEDVSVEWSTPPWFTPPDESRESRLCRIPDAALRSLVERSLHPAMLLSEWTENLATLEHRTCYSDAFDEKLATDLYKLARAAVESGGSVYGLCFLDTTDLDELKVALQRRPI